MVLTFSDKMGIWNYCVVLDGDKNLLDEWLNRIFLNEYLTFFSERVRQVRVYKHGLEWHLIKFYTTLLNHNHTVILLLPKCGQKIP